MALWFNGYEVKTDFQTFDKDSSAGSKSNPVLGRRKPHVEKGISSEQSFSAHIVIGDTKVDTILANLKTILESEEPVLIRSDMQNLWGAVKAVYVHADSVSITRPPGFPHMGEIEFSGYILGVPASAGGDAMMGTFWNAAPVPVYSGELATGANPMEPSWWFPFSQGGRHGMTVEPESTTWQMHSENDLSVLSGGTNVAVTKDSDGTGVLRFKGPATVRLAKHQFKNGYFSVRFRAKDPRYLVTDAVLNLSIRANAADTSRYTLQITRTSKTNGQLNIAKVVSGVITNLVSVNTPSCFDGNWHTLTFFARETELFGILDGTVYAYAKDSDLSAADGFRLNTLGNLEFNFTDFGHSKSLGAVHVPLSPRAMDVTTRNKAADIRYRPIGRNLLGNVDAGGTTGWTVQAATGTPTLASDTAFIRHGPASLKVGGDGTDRTLTRTMSTVPGKTYIFEAWARSGQGGSSTSSDYRIGAAGSYSTSLATTGTNRNWVRARVTFTATSTTTDLIMYSADTGTVWWDDISVRECIPVLVNPAHRKLINQEAIE